MALLTPPSGWFQRTRRFVVAHKIISAIVVVVVIWGGYSLYHKLFPTTVPTRYVVSTAQQGTLVVAVTGSGQVSSTNQVDVKSKVSGDVLSVKVVQGQKVSQGAVMAQLDASDASKAVRDATNTLQSAQIALQKLQAGQQSDTPKLQADLANAYQDAFSSVATAFLSLPTMETDIHGILYDNTMAGSCSPNLCQYGNIISASTSHEFDALKYAATTAESTAATAYNPNFNDYKSADVTSDTTTITNLLNETLATTQLMSQAIKNEQNLLDTLVQDITDQATLHNTHSTVPAQLTTYQNTIATDIGKLNSTIVTLRNQQRTITNAQQALADAQSNNPLDVASQQNAIQRDADALADAKTNLANATIRAPFDGIIAKVTMKKGDTANAGSVVATLVTTQQLATLTLNEVDAAKVAVGQPATLTFDAVPDLTIAGTVATVDTVGTVSQGVVTYTVTIAFATQDTRVKPGMSTSAAIATQVKTDVLTVPSSAVKTQGGQSYVMVIDGELPDTATTTGFTPSSAPRQVVVQTGLSNNTQVEITSGLAQGDHVVSRTITTAVAATSSAPSILNAAGGGGNATFRATTGTTGR